MTLPVQVPLAAVPSQTLSIVLGGQNCQISVYQQLTGLYFDLALDGVPVVVGRICRRKAPLISQTYSGFVGEFKFVDTQGVSDPDYTQLGTTGAARFQLAYLETPYP